MPKLSREQVLSALRRVKGPDLSSDIVSLGMISDIMISGGKVIFSITVPAERARELEPLRAGRGAGPARPARRRARRWWR